MEHERTLTIGTVALAAALQGCAGAGALQGQLRRTTGELAIERAGPAAPPAPRPGTVALGEVTVEQALVPETTVTRTGGVVIPLLFLNFWKHHYRADLGAAQVRPPLQDALRASLAEALAHGAHPLADAGADLTVDLRITGARATTALEEEGDLFLVLFWVSLSNRLRWDAAQAQLDAELTVRRAGEPLLHRRLRAIGSAPPHGKKDGLAGQAQALTEALAVAARSLDEQVVAEVDAL